MSSGGQSWSSELVLKQNVLLENMLSRSNHGGKSQLQAIMGSLLSSDMLSWDSSAVAGLECH